MFHWPVTTDAPVIRIGWPSFLFAVPGLLYALQIPLSSTEMMLDDLISFFRVHSDYEDHKETATATAFPIAEVDKKFWAEARLPYELYLHRKLAEFGHYPGRSITSIQWRYYLAKATHALAMSFMGSVLQCAHIKIYSLELNKTGTVVKRTSPRIRASYAHIYVQQKRQKEKLKRLEEERARKEGVSKVEIVIEESQSRKTNSNKVHPGSIISPSSIGGCGK